MDDPIESARTRMERLLGLVAGREYLPTIEVDKISVTFSEILEELAVASEELRLQNEELADARDRIELERQRYQELFEYAPDAYIITDAKGLILEANRAAAILLNTDRLLLTGKPILVYINEEDLTQVSRILRSTGAVQDIEIGIRPHRASRAYVSVTTNAVPGSGNQPAQIRWIMRDVTEQRKTLAALDASEQRFRTIFDQSSLGLVQLDLNGKVLRANRAFLDMLGIGPDTTLDHFFSLLESSEDEGTALTQAFQSVARGKQPVPLQKTCLKGPDGRIIWVGIALSPMRIKQGRVRFVIAMIENITAEHQAEIDLAEMRRRLLESGEAERLRLAQELHDGPMQDLYGAVFHLTDLPGLEGAPEAGGKIKEIQEILKHVAGTLRAICGELRPPTLANLGLERAIRSHAEQIQETHSEINLQLQLTHETQVIPPHIRMALFRIYQQCMTNVLRHAQASQVMVSFHVNEQEVVLDVWDNGKGFTLPEKWVELLREGHYGLAGIAERVDAMGGVLKIDTRPGAGTLVHVSAPLPAGKEA